MPNPSAASRSDDSDAPPAPLSPRPHQHQPLVKRRRTVKDEQRRSSRACLECRLAKTKCLVQDDDDICQRCQRFSFDCKFVRHHRGRKPVSKLASLSASASLSAINADATASDESSDHTPDPTSHQLSVSQSRSRSHTHHTHTQARPKPDSSSSHPSHSQHKPDDRRSASPPSSSLKASVTSSSAAAPSRSSAVASGKRPVRDSPVELDVAARRRIWEMLASKIAQRGSTYMFVNKGELDHDPNAAGPSNKSNETALAPGPTAQSHLSTFRHLLQPLDKRGGGVSYPESEARAVRFPRLPDTITLIGTKDPCDSGILSLAAARRLYDYYFANINPWAMVFDPALVSHESIRNASAFLYTVILYLASRYIQLSPDHGWYASSTPAPGSDAITATISARLGSHARSLAVQAFALGDRNMETAIAFYLASVWKEADDHFSALYCSYAGKIMSDLPSSLLSEPAGLAGPSRRPDPLRPPAPSEMGLRLRRHQQRVFLFHYIQEHALLLHFAPRPNFDRGPALLRNLLAWADDDLNTEDDCLLCADIDHMLLQTKYKSIMERAQVQEKDTVHGGSECFLLFQSFLDEIDGWHKKWEYQVRKVAKKFRCDPKEAPEAGEEERPKAFEASIPLPARLSLLQIFRNSTVMQISSIAFRASLRDLNKVNARTTERTATAGSTATKSARAQNGSGGAHGGAGRASSLMDDRTEQIYNACLESALNLLYHSIQMPPSVLRHSQDLIMVLTPHAALLATYLISLPLPHIPAHSSSDDGSASSARQKGKASLQRRKEYERRCLELLRGARDHFRNACARDDDHVALCWRYIDSLLIVIERPDSVSEQASKADAGVGGASSTSTREARARAGEAVSAAPPPVGRNRSRLTTRWLSYGNEASMASNLDNVAAQTLLNLHTEAQSNTTPNASPPPLPPPSFAGSFGPLPDGRSPYPPPTHFHASPGPSSGTLAARNFGSGRSAKAPFSPDPNGAGGGGGGGMDTFSPSSSSSSAVAVALAAAQQQQQQQAGTPVDWTWLQSFLELPEFSWM
ncbi:hypothetical protein ACQY0O_007438 [Thecaphora frezii]